MASAGSDPWRAWEELHRQMMVQAAKLLAEEARSGSKPDRVTTDRLRELRQLTEALTAYRAGHAADEQAHAFFATLDERIGTAVERLGLVVHPAVSEEQLERMRSDAAAAIGGARTGYGHDWMRQITTRVEDRLPVGSALRAAGKGVLLAFALGSLLTLVIFGLVLLQFPAFRHTIFGRITVPPYGDAAPSACLAGPALNIFAV